MKKAAKVNASRTRNERALVRQRSLRCAVPYAFEGLVRRHGLTVHQLQLQPQRGTGAWHFTATLTQNLNRGAVNRGTLTLSIEGSRDGKLQQLDWGELRQGGGSAGVDYSFKYFQQVEGDVLLPRGFQPIRVTVHLDPARGAAVEQSFAWEEAITRPQQRG